MARVPQYQVNVGLLLSQLAASKGFAVVALNRKAIWPTDSVEFNVESMRTRIILN
jgi:hypothetical protein